MMFPPEAETGVGVAGKLSAAPPAAWAATLKECGRGKSHVFPRPCRPGHRRGRKQPFCHNTEGVWWISGAVGNFDNPKWAQLPEKDLFDSMPQERND